MTTDKINWGMAVVVLSLLGGAFQMGSLQQQVLNTAKDSGEAKVATALLAASQKMTEMELRERLAKLEERARK